MPLKKGTDPHIISQNIREMMKSGAKQKQAVAAALSMKRKSARMAKGGLVNEDFDSEGTPQPVDAGREDSMHSDEPSAVDEHLSYRQGSPDDIERSLPQEMEDGEYHPSLVANPEEKSLARMLEEQEMEMMADGGVVAQPTPTPPIDQEQAKSAQDSMRKAFKFAEGGMVDAEPEPRENDGTEEPLSSMRLSEEQQQAIMARKKKRRYVQSS